MVRRQEKKLYDTADGVLLEMVFTQTQGVSRVRQMQGIEFFIDRGVLMVRRQEKNCMTQQMVCYWNAG